MPQVHAGLVATRAAAASALPLLLLLPGLWTLPPAGARPPPGPDPLRLGWQRLLAEGEACAPCRPGECAVPRGCLAGRAPDTCGCCWECANLEGQLCDLDPSAHFYGRCGEQLECRLDAGDALSRGEVPEPRCACRSQRPLCGSDGRTYAQICRLREAARARPDANLTAAHPGPCESGAAHHPLLARPRARSAGSAQSHWIWPTAGSERKDPSVAAPTPEPRQWDWLLRSEPQILSQPRDVWNVTGQDVIFGCEVFAYPMASIEWRKDGLDIQLPGDDPHISVQFRGGPQRFEVTSWLQIQAVRPSDEGTYRCLARNALGQVEAPAMLTVLTPGQLNSTGLPPGHSLSREPEEETGSDEGEDYY